MLGQRYLVVVAKSLISGEEIEFHEPIDEAKLDERSFEAAMIRARLAAVAERQAANRAACQT